MNRPRPVPSPAGLVVKKGLNIFSLTSGETPVPLSRIADLHAVAEVLRRSNKGRLKAFTGVLLFTFTRRIEAVGDQVQESACDLLREYIDLTGVVQY